MSWAWGSGEREADEAGALLGRRAEDVEAVDFAQPLVGVAGQLVFVAVRLRRGRSTLR